LNIAYGKIGGIAEEQGKLKEARAYYERALEGYKNVVEQAPYDEDARYNLGVAYANMGAIAEAEGDLQQAKQYNKLSQRLISPPSLFAKLLGWIKGLFGR